MFLLFFTHFYSIFHPFTTPISRPENLYPALSIKTRHWVQNGNRCTESTQHWSLYRLIWIKSFRLPSQLAAALSISIPLQLPRKHCHSTALFNFISRQWSRRCECLVCRGNLRRFLTKKKWSSFKFQSNSVKFSQIQSKSHRSSSRTSLSKSGETKVDFYDLWSNKLPFIEFKSNRC